MLDISEYINDGIISLLFYSMLKHQVFVVYGLRIKEPTFFTLEFNIFLLVGCVHLWLALFCNVFFYVNGYSSVHTNVNAIANANPNSSKKVCGCSYF